MQNETMPKMFGAFRTTASSGGANPSYEMVFKFASMADMHAADDEWIAFRRAREALATPTGAENAQVRGEDISEIVAPWADFHGDLPDYDHPLRCVFESGVQYAVELLAKELDVTDWQICEGTEEFDGDLGGTLMNIVRAAMPEDAYGERMWPSEVRAALTATPQAPAGEQTAGEGVEGLAKWLHDEGGFGDAWTNHTWPEHPDDTGRRDGGFVKIVPSDVQALYRDCARRLLLGRRLVRTDAPTPDQFAENAKCSGMEELAARLAEAAVDAANIVTNDGYYEIDIEAATHAILAALSAQSGGGR